MEKQYEVEIPYVLPSANAQLRMHFQARKKLKDRCMQELLVAKSAAGALARKHGLEPHWPKLLKRFHLTIERHAVQEQDADNGIAAHKQLIDALSGHGGMGLIVDDGPFHMLSVKVIHIASKRKNQRTILRFTEG